MSENQEKIETQEEENKLIVRNLQLNNHEAMVLLDGLSRNDQAYGLAKQNRGLKKANWVLVEKIEALFNDEN